jgi:antirestriction protein ArdC
VHFDDPGLLGCTPGCGVKSHKPSTTQIDVYTELGSAFLCAEAGIDNSELDNSAAYIQSWLKALRNDKRLLISASSHAAKATHYILGQTEEG